MATVIFVDQENGDVAPVSFSKGLLKTTRSAKPLLRSHQGKVFGNSGTVEKPRKALGNVNKQLVHAAAPHQKGAIKVKTPAPLIKKNSESCIKPAKQSYPKIDKFIPYDPADFETFDIPEEHKLSHLYLGGVPLMVYENYSGKFDALLTQELAPMNVPDFTWDSDISSALPSLTGLEEILLDLPQMVVC